MREKEEAGETEVSRYTAGLCAPPHVSEQVNQEKKTAHVFILFIYLELASILPSQDPPHCEGWRDAEKENVFFSGSDSTWP